MRYEVNRLTFFVQLVGFVREKKNAVHTRIEGAKGILVGINFDGGKSFFPKFFGVFFGVLYASAVVLRKVKKRLTGTDIGNCKLNFGFRHIQGKMAIFIGDFRSYGIYCALREFKQEIFLEIILIITAFLGGISCHHAAFEINIALEFIVNTENRKPTWLIGVEFQVHIGAALCGSQRKITVGAVDVHINIVRLQFHFAENRKSFLRVGLQGVGLR